MSSTHDKEIGPMIPWDYACLNKIGIMIASVHMPMWMGKSHWAQLLNEEPQVIMLDTDKGRISFF